MEQRYVRNLGALTASECGVLREKRIFVAGCGGLGGYLIESLLRLGVGGITVCDGDEFEPSNLTASCTVRLACWAAPRRRRRQSGRCRSTQRSMFRPAPSF